MQKRHLSIGLMAIVVITATVASFSSIAMAATPQACFTFTKVNNTSGAVISVATQPVSVTSPFVATYPAGNRSITTQAIIDGPTGILNAVNEPGVFYVGFVLVIGSRIAYDFGGGPGDNPEDNFEGEYSKYKVASAGNCAQVATAQVNRSGMCSNIPVARVTGGLGHFLDLASGQSLVGVTLTPAIFVQGLGLMCFQSEIATYGGNPSAYRATGTTVGGDGTPGSGYPYYSRI